MLRLKTTCKISLALAVLVIAFVSLWAAANPAIALAANASARCANGSMKSCSGTTCQSQDSTSGSSGYCACTRSDGTVQVKFCDDGPVMEVCDY